LNLKKSNKSQEGFSLIELVVVTAVLATLSAIAIPRFMGIINNARLQSSKQNLSNCLKECIYDSNKKPELGSIPGVIFEGGEDCKSIAKATINNECCISINLETSKKDKNNIWPSNYSSCNLTSCETISKSENSGGGKGNENDDTCNGNPNVTKDGFFKDDSALGQNCVVYGGITNVENYNFTYCSCDRPCDQYGQLTACGTQEEINETLKTFCEETGWGKNAQVPYC